MAAFLLLGRGDRSSTIKCAKKEQSMERQSRAHINPDFGAFSALGAPDRCIERQQDFGGGECFPRLAERCWRPKRQEPRNDLSGDLFVRHPYHDGAGEIGRPGPQPIGSGFDRLAKRDCERGIWRIALHESSQANVSALLMVFVFLTSREVRPQVL
jgi:hypothetical protein